MVKDRSDLANGDDFQPVGFHDVHKCFFGRLYRVVAASFGTAKRARRSNEWPGDYSSHLIFAGKQRPRSLAPLIELVQRNDFFMGCNLKHAVGRRVHNWLSGSNMLLAQLFDYFGSRGSLVAQHLATDSLLKLVDYPQRKPISIGGKCLFDYQSAHFPVTGGCVLAIGPRR